MDTFTADKRSEVMKRVASKNTTPEMAVRKLVHGLGFRYSLHRSDLPGKPDLVLNSRRKVILVHGCFWHGHTCRSGRNQPASNIEYWRPKLERTRVRDRSSIRKLRRLGWSVAVVWECQVGDAGALSLRLSRFLGRAYE